MKENKFSSVSNIVKTNEHLTNVLKKADKLKNLNNFVVSFLDENTAQNIKVSNYRAGLLTIQASTAAYAAKMKYHYVPSLLSSLKSACNWTALKDIRIVVQPVQDFELQRPQENIERYISEYNSKLLTGLADNVSCSKLKASLLRLAAHHKS